jgi:hypothetical protein
MGNAQQQAVQADETQCLLTGASLFDNTWNRMTGKVIVSMVALWRLSMITKASESGLKKRSLRLMMEMPSDM